MQGIWVETRECGKWGGNVGNLDGNVVNRGGNAGNSTFKMLKVPTLNKNKKEKENTNKWKGFSVSVSRFELNNVGDLKIIGKLVLKFLIFLRVSQKYGVFQLSYEATRYFNSSSYTEYVV